MSPAPESPAARQGEASPSDTANTLPGGARPIAIVTGATGGIGRVIAADLALDHDVLAIGRDAAWLAKLDAIEGVTALGADLNDFATLAVLIGALPRLDVLVHCAAIAPRHTVESAAAADWQATFAVNVFAPAELSRLALPLLRAGRGQIIFINSGAGLTGLGGHVVYSASKFALKALADGLRKEEEHAGVRVSSVHPGPTSKGGEHTEDEVRSRPESVAKAVRMVVEATEDTQITTVYVRPRIELGTS